MIPSIALAAFLRLRCPHCGETPVFAPVSQLKNLNGWFDTRPGCPRCEYPFEREPGYFLLATWGTVFFPAASLSVALMLLLPRWFRLSDSGLLLAMLFPTVLFAVAISRHGRLLFLIVDHFFDPVNDEDRKRYREMPSRTG